MTYHPTQQKEIEAAISSGSIDLTSAGGGQVRLYKTPESLASGIASRFKTCYCIVGSTLYTPTPAAFIGKGGKYVKWSASNGGWSNVVGIDVHDGQRPGDTLRVLVNGMPRYAALPDAHPSWIGEWKN